MDVKLTCGNKPMALPSEGECCGDGVRSVTSKILANNIGASVFVSESFTPISVIARTASGTLVAIDWERLNSNIVVSIAEPYNEDITVTINYV